jgi:hypothetical protein
MTTTRILENPRELRSRAVVEQCEVWECGGCGTRRVWGNADGSGPARTVATLRCACGNVTPHSFAGVHALTVSRTYREEWIGGGADYRVTEVRWLELETRTDGAR